MSCYCGDSKNCLQCIPRSKRDEWLKKESDKAATKKKRSEASKKANKRHVPMDDVSKITAEKMKELLDKAREGRKQRDHDRYAKPKCETGTCVVCKGVVTEEYTQVADRDFMHIPIGPASRDCFRWRHDGCHCTKCGLKYEFLPPK